MFLTKYSPLISYVSFSKTLPETFLILRRNVRDIIKKMYIGLHVQYRLLLSDFNETWIFFDRFSKNTEKSTFMNIRPVGAELSHADRQTDRWADMTKLNCHFSSFCERTSHFNRGSIPKSQLQLLKLRIKTKKMEILAIDYLWIKTNRCSEFQFYWYYYSTCFGQSFCPSSGVLSRTSALVHFMQLWWTVCYQE